MKSLALHRVDHREVDSNRDRGRSVGVCLPYLLPLCVIATAHLNSRSTLPEEVGQEVLTVWTYSKGVTVGKRCVRMNLPHRSNTARSSFHMLY